MSEWLGRSEEYRHVRTVSTYTRWRQRLFDADTEPKSFTIAESESISITVAKSIAFTVAVADSDNQHSHRDQRVPYSRTWWGQR